ncbi:TonB-dependent siderophore receptor [Achromobacter spanius]|uniref:TonB-dependent siderophore receptor n=1 Tax=Achromobacter spanius TaxID=217203 RepID=A0A2S0I3S3_9BURK|nr:TonB-dependent siderophore receptor [Achromobacter spanius]AVJ26675.1 TonB-dependent siderophore receptor [Achromobacter spanius]
MASRHFHCRPSVGRYALLCALSMTVLAAGALTSRPAHAQAAQAQAIELAAGSLADSLVSLGRQAQVQILFSPGAVAGLQAPAVSGRLTPQAALDRLLARSGLVAVPSGAGFIVRAPSGGGSSDATTLAPVTVTGRDLATTEGTGSYTTPAVTIGKNVQSLREIPQSISVVTRQLLDDQNLVNLDDAMRTVTGVTVEAGSVGGNHGNFYSRGYALDTIQVDGVNTPASTGNDLSAGFGLAIYDRIEVLRGPAGLFQGAGDPGGTVNLVRKRAQRDFAFSGQVMAGSWDRYYTEADITGPLDSDGRLRGRLVASYDDRRSFVDGVYTRKPLFYGTMSFDVTPDTTLTAGATYQQYKGRPFFGLPAYTDGRLLDVRRSTNLDPSWNHITEEITEYFADVEHRLSNGGRIKVSGLYREQDEPSREFGWSDCAVDPLTGDTCLVSWKYRSNWKTYGLDAFVSTPFDAFGRTHELIVGADYRNVHKNFQYGGGDTADINLYHPDNDIPKPDYEFTNGNDSKTHQYGLYARTNLRVADAATIIAGGRLTWWNNKTANRNAYFNQFTNTDTSINGKFTPYLGLVVDLNDQLSAYTSYTSIFSPQTVTDANGQPLDARTGKQFEIGLKGEFLDKRLNGHVALFRMDDENRAMTDPDNPLFSMAAGKMRNQGFEAEISGSPAPGWAITAGYAYTTTKTLKGTEDQKSQQYVFITPRHTFNLWTKYSFASGPMEGWSLGAGVRSVSSMYRLNGPVKFEQRPYTTVSAQAGYRFNKHVDATLTVNNLFDKVYYQRVWAAYGSNYYGEPRSVMLAVRATY